MRTWTIQKRSVLKQIQEEGFYIPNFAHRDINNKSLPNSYKFLLALMNHIYKPKKRIEGVVFCMAPSFDTCFRNIDNIENHFLSNPGCSKYFVNEGISLLEGDNIILELNYPDEFLFLDVDVELFCALDECLYINEECKGWQLRRGNFFSEKLMERINKLANDWCKANSKEFLFQNPVNLVQQHIPFIQVDNIVSYYPVSILKLK